MTVIRIGLVTTTATMLLKLEVFGMAVINSKYEFTTEHSQIICSLKFKKLINLATEATKHKTSIKCDVLSFMYNSH